MSDDLSGFSLMDLFRSEAESHAQTLSTGLLALESGKVLVCADFEPLMRAAHSIKGAARIVGLDSAVGIAHVMEDCFVAVQKGQRTLQGGDIDNLLAALDLLTQISELPEGESEAWAETHRERIESVVSAVREVQPEAPAAPETSSTPVVQEDPPAVADPEPTVDAPPLKLEEETPTQALPSPEPEIQAEAPSSEPADRVVRVTAQSLTRLMSLAGESLIQSRRLKPFVDSLLAVKTNQSKLLNTLQSLQEKMSSDSTSRNGLQEDILDRAKSQASECSQALGATLEQIDEFARRGEDLSLRLHHEVQISRMRPLGDGIRGFPRLVRDLSRKLGKNVQFRVTGETTGVDRDILEKLEAPLNHLIRNSLDHGLETPAERLSSGKVATGTIHLEAKHRAGMLQVRLSDDGRGIDPEALRTKVVQRGLASKEIASKFNEVELFEFLFLPGFSTKEQVTEISGRGVGLDVVRNMVREVSGLVRVSSKPGRGTQFTLQLPITMSVIRALLVEIAGEPYAFPLNRIEQILRLPRSKLQTLEGRHHFVQDGEAVGLADSAEVLELDKRSEWPATIAVVVIGDGTHRFGLSVDEFLGERDLEVRPLDPRLGKVPNINSASILEDGRPVLIFDAEDLVRSIDNLTGGRKSRGFFESLPTAEVGRTKRVLVVDDSITVRELERQVLEGRGYQVDVAVDGFDGWNTIRTGRYDLVISDVDMPRMDGIQFVGKIKKDSTLRHTPVIIVSYKDREEDRMRGLDAGANAYLTKSSFRDETFLQTVVDLIGESS